MFKPYMKLLSNKIFYQSELPWVIPYKLRLSLRFIKRMNKQEDLSLCNLPKRKSSYKHLQANHRPSFEFRYSIKMLPFVMLFFACVII